MSNTLYVRTVLTIPGAGQAIHVAELEENDTESCRMQRLIALAPNDSIVGAATPGRAHGNVDTPSAIVPHPSTYDQFPDVTTEYVEPGYFEGLWAEAQVLFSGLEN